MPSTCQPTRSDPSVRVHALSSGTQRQGRRRAVAWYPVPADPDTRPVSRASCEVMDARRDSCDPGWRSDCVVVRVTSPFLVAYPAEVERQQEQLTADLSDVSDSEDDAPGGGAFAPPFTCLTVLVDEVCSLASGCHGCGCCLCLNRGLAVAGRRAQLVLDADGEILEVVHTPGFRRPMNRGGMARCIAIALLVPHALLSLS